MIRNIELENFTVFRGKQTVGFAPGLNVVIGENGSGKSHLLKVAYALAAASHSAAGTAADRKDFASVIAEKLLGVFRPDLLGHLVHHASGESLCRLAIRFGESAEDFSLEFSPRSRSEVRLTEAPRRYLDAPCVYLPTAEILSGYSGFVSLARQGGLAFDETYYDLTRALESPVNRSLGTAEKELLRRIEGMIGGEVQLEGGRFYLERPKRGRIEMTLAGEGLGKIATVAHLIRNGTLRHGTLLFWDEPETNLNPRLIRKVADILMTLAVHGIQVFLTTHSLFLLREIEILAGRRSFAGLSQRYIALGYDAKKRLLLHQADSIEAVEPVVTLDEALSQADRYLELE